MRNILVFQHVAHEILGTLNPLLKDRGLRIRYVNFARTPDYVPKMKKYNGLIVLGGPMGVYESSCYPHLKTEMAAIETALKNDLPVLGICLGAQLLAHVLGANVHKGRKSEIGWSQVHRKKGSQSDPVLKAFKSSETVFQLHGDNFQIPQGAQHLAWNETSEGQAFRYGKKAYGFQFHLEVDEKMIYRWLKVPVIQKDIAATNGRVDPEEIRKNTPHLIQRSLELSTQTFSHFIDLFDVKSRTLVAGSGHEKPNS